MASSRVTWDFDLDITPEEAEKFMEIDDIGRIQKIVDSSFIHYMRLKMPWDNGIMASQTKATKPGEVIVDVPYGHYMNEGILYVNPAKGRSGFPQYKDGVMIGFTGYRGKRVPTATPLHFKGAPTRGAHFVERTIAENKQDIINEAMRSMKHD